MNTKKSVMEFRKENLLSYFIPYSLHVDNNTIKCKDGDYLQIIRLSGIPHESAEVSDLVTWQEQLNVLLKNIASPNVSLWTNLVRREQSTYPQGEFNTDFSNDLNKKYQSNLSKNKMFVNELYISVIYNPGSKLVQKYSNKFKKYFDEFSGISDYFKSEQNDCVDKLTEITEFVVSNLVDYGPKLLSAYVHKEQLHSELIEFLSFLVNGESQRRRLPKQDLSESLAFNRVFFGPDAFEIRRLVDMKVGATLRIGEYPEITHPGLMNAMLSAPFELILTQSFNFLSKPVGLELLVRQQRRMRNAGDMAESQILAMDDALDDLASGHIVFGEHHLSLTVFADNMKDLKSNLSGARANLVDCSMVIKREDIGLQAAFWSQLPCNFKYRTAPSAITSRNFAGFSSFHNYPIGREHGNQWGASVTMFKTTSGSPYYFNFHEKLDSSSSKPTNNKSEQKALGNTVIIGPSGSGKTVLQGFLMSQSKKFNPTQVIFDKDRGLEIYVRAEGGVYLALKNGVSTGFNPFQLENNELNCLFLENLIKVCAGGTFTSADENDINMAVRIVMAHDKSSRSMAAFMQGLKIAKHENSVSERIEKWCGTGNLAWVFDNQTDALTFDNNSMFGFDVTDFLENDEIRTPVIMYLFHRVEQLIDGRRIMIFMDEFWKLLKDDYFEDLAQNKLKVIRKQNGILVLGTQSPKDVLSSKIAHSIIEQCATMIFMPNPKGSAEDYIDGFKLTTREYEIIRTELLPGSRCFLIKQGHDSIVAKLDLKGFSDELAIISGTTDNVLLVEEIIEQVGPDPKDWLSEFQSQRK